MTWLVRLKPGRRVQQALAAVALLVGTAPLDGLDLGRRPIDAVDEIRERLRQSDLLSSPAPEGATRSHLVQWLNWPNWPNWPNWGNWPNWRNW